MTAPGALAPGLARTATDAAVRRADWRFLLPDAGARRVYVDAAGALAASVAVALPAAERVAAAADLAVVGDADDARLRAAHAALHDGGVCYVEWPDRPPRSAAAVRASLAGAGFVGVRVFRRWPSAARCAAWLPVDDGAAVAGFLAEWRAFARHPLRRAQRAAVALLARATLRRRRAPALVAVAARSRGAGAAPVAAPPHWLPAVRTFVRQGADGAASAAPASWYVATHGWRAESRVLGVLVARDGARVAVAKLARRPDVAARLAHEATVLEALAAAPGVPSGAPALLGRLHAPGAGDAATCPAPVTVERAIRGRPLDAVATRRAAPHLARSAAGWLARLAVATGPSSRAAPSAGAAACILDAFALRFGAVVDPAALAATRRLVDESEPLAAVLEHRDFAPWNLRAHGRAVVGVLDWETAVLDGLPGLDLLYFLACLWASVDGTLGTAAMRASLREALDARTARGAVHARCWTEYCDAVGIGVPGQRALRALVWPLHCLSEHRRLVEEVGTPTAADLRRCSLLGLWEEELAALGAAQNRPGCSPRAGGV